MYIEFYQNCYAKLRQANTFKILYALTFWKNKTLCKSEIWLFFSQTLSYHNLIYLNFVLPKPFCLEKIENPVSGFRYARNRICSFLFY